MESGHLFPESLKEQTVEARDHRSFTEFQCPGHSCTAETVLLSGKYYLLLDSWLTSSGVHIKQHLHVNRTTPIDTHSRDTGHKGRLKASGDLIEYRLRFLRPYIGVRGAQESVAFKTTCLLGTCISLKPCTSLLPSSSTLPATYPSFQTLRPGDSSFRMSRKLFGNRAHTMLFSNDMNDVAYLGSMTLRMKAEAFLNRSQD
ncbi:hypothetical protein FA15DRAFT_742925 [Coprinopsis marcescibilis]|uniref:Uncharacterized protein n=1 Tax=Coprinopsis marcescibilis TaxID=230819 RepID=A0A5C3KUF5_COPMA|nr:hypothetical protein FA15DRAFT_742925 [Coprinopsis marcescibilis]